MFPFKGLPRRPVGQFKQWAMGPCFYCGRATFRCKTRYHVTNKPWHYTRDHIFPAWFRTTLEKRPNLRDLTVTACFWCNCQKANKMPEMKSLERLGVEYKNGEYNFAPKEAKEKEESRQLVTE